MSADSVAYWRSQNLRAAVELGVFELLPAKKIDCDRLFWVATVTGDRLLKPPGELGYIYQTNRRTRELTDNGGRLDLNMLAIAGSCEENFGQFQRLLKQTGFEINQKMELTSG